MMTTKEQIAALVKQANSLLVAVGNKPLDMPEFGPTYRTPTNRDLLSGPIECEVRDADEQKWKAATLTAIDTSGRKPHPFFAGTDSYDRCWFAQCRTPAEPELPSEQPEWELIAGVLFLGEWRVEIEKDPVSGYDFSILASQHQGETKPFDCLNEAMAYVEGAVND